MELTEIKSRVFGYSKKSVCQYISELNILHDAELEAQKDAATKAAENYVSQIKNLSDSNKTLSQNVNSLRSEVEELRQKIAELELVNTTLNAEYDAMAKETEELRAKSDVISTAIINAEKCASSMINEANTRAQDMIDEAHVKVEDEVKRLENAKQYITEVRSAVEHTLRKIDAELGGIEADISHKTQDISEDKKANVKEKFGILDKNFFKRA